MSLTDRQINYLGALLHDIGKLVWRAQEVKPGDNHEKLGSEFIREYLGKVACLREDIEEIIKAANRQRGKIWKADIIAAEEREDSEDSAPRRYLESICNRVNLGYDIKKKSENYWYYLPRPLIFDEEEKIAGEHFPVDSKKSLQEYSHNEEEYVRLHKDCLKKFTNEIQLLENYNDYEAFVSTFYKLLEKYTARVLSAGYLSHPDISLFDHSRITAALSLCYEEGLEGNECLLIKGDITGIQSYIYEDILEMTDIAKRLRGRSFIVQILNEVISFILLNKLQLYDSNIIYVGGGHFLILAPNNEDLLKRLNYQAEYINQFLRSYYLGKINLLVDYVSCSGQDFINNFKEVYLTLDKKLNEKKKQKFKVDLKYLFSRKLTAVEIRKKERDIIEEETNVGQLIPKLKYLVYVTEANLQKIKSNSLQLPYYALDTLIFLCKDKQEVENIISQVDKKYNLKITAINDTNFLNEFKEDRFNNISKEFKFLGNHVPMSSKGNILSFEEFAEIDSANYPLIGILRLDIDNLGAVFSFGLSEKSDKEKKYTPSRVANLSRELNWFFSFYINLIAKKHNIYIAYSGGDDVFVVGNWYILLKFARELRNKFERFACENENLSVSAGIVFTKPNFPISQSSRLAGFQESLAKDTDPKIEKNKIGILDIQLKWNEFSEFIDYADDLINFVSTQEGKQIIPRSFLHNLYSLTTSLFDSKGRLLVNKLNKAISVLHYQFARRKVNYTVMESNNTTNKVNELLYKLALMLLLSKNREETYKKIKFPLTLVLYKTRR